jgi:hypothetical protein
VRESNGRAELTKVKCTHSVDSSRNPPTLTLELITEDKTVKEVQCVCWGEGNGEGGRVNEGDEGEGIWLMGFIYICKME